MGEMNLEQPIFGPATLLFLGRRAPWLCSLVTPRGQPKSLVAPSTFIYEMGSRTGMEIELWRYTAGAYFARLRGLWHWTTFYWKRKRK